MEKWQRLLDGWRDSLCAKIELGALHSRSPIAHKWKATYRSLALRELTIWRVHDLLDQALYLAKSQRLLGALILLRSAFEALAILIYINEKTSSVLSGDESFFAFDELTTRLMLGSKNNSTPHESINVLTVLKHCDRKYPGILAVYEALSECAHPNYEGMCKGYSAVDVANDLTDFRNRWVEVDGGRFLSGLELCLRVFEVEYNDIWKMKFEQLEQWLVANDAKLEAEKDLA